MLTLREASEAVGMSKPGLLKAIRSGKVSAEKDIHGEWMIQPVELFRVYEPVAKVNGNGDEPVSPEVNAGYREETSDYATVNAGLRAENAQLLARLADKDDLIRAKDDLIEALRGENNRLSVVIAQLTPPKAQRGWWQRLLGTKE